MTPQDVIQVMKDSGLRGRGGAGFPTGLKWELALKQESQQKYIICNADEGDPVHIWIDLFLKEIPTLLSREWLSLDMQQEQVKDIYM